MTGTVGGSYVVRTVTRRRACHILCVVGLAAYGGLLFWFRIGSGDVKNYGFASADAFLYFYPSYEQMYARVRDGLLPRWNPFQMFGTPWLATLQPGLYYPGHLAYLVLPAHTAMAVAGVSHLLLAAVGLYAFLIGVGLGSLGALTGAVVFAFRGYFLTCLSGPNLMEAGAWIGVGALGVVWLVERRTMRSAVLLAVATAMSLLAGAPQHTAYLIYVWGTLWLARTIAARVPLPAAVGGGAVFAAAMMLALLLAAAQILPTAEVMSAGTRSTSQLPANVLSPIGNPAVTILERFPIVGMPHSFGVVPLVLVAVATLGGRHLGLLVWVFLVGTVSAVFALGTETPLFGIYRALPGLGMFRGPDRILLLTDFSLAVAAAIAIDVLVRGPDVSTSRRARVAVAAPTLVAAAAWALVHVRLGTPGALSVAVGVVIGGVLTLLVRGTRAGLAMAALGLVLVAVEIFVRTDLKLVLPYTADKVQWLRSNDPSYRYLAMSEAHDRIWFLSALDPPLAAKQATRHALRSIEDYEPMNFTRQNRYLTYFGQGALPEFVNDVPFLGYVPGGLGSPPNPSSPGTRRRLLDLGAVAQIVMPTARAGQPRAVQFLTAAGLGRNEAAGPLAVVRNPNAVARAFLVYRTAPAPSDQPLLERLADPAFDPLTLAYVEGDPGFTPAADAPARGVAARFLEDGEDVVELEATAVAPALLVLSDTYAAGWRATVDGVAAPIVPTDYLFRGVPVPAGTHRVRFVYRPWTIPAGQAISLGSLLALAVMWLRRKRDLAPTPTTS